MRFRGHEATHKVFGSDDTSDDFIHSILNHKIPTTNGDSPGKLKVSFFGGRSGV